jgi:hypothetical protein
MFCSFTQSLYQYKHMYASLSMWLNTWTQLTSPKLSTSTSKKPGILEFICLQLMTEHTWEHNQETIETSLLCRAKVNASSYFCSAINLDNSFVGSKGTSGCLYQQIHKSDATKSFVTSNEDWSFLLKAKPSQLFNLEATQHTLKKKKKPTQQTKRAYHLMHTRQWSIAQLRWWISHLWVCTCSRHS